MHVPQILLNLLTVSNNKSLDDTKTGNKSFSDLCELVGCRADVLKLENNPITNIRGVYLQKDFAANDVVIKIPIRSCLRDDRPPEWLSKETIDDHDSWATRLAACFLQEDVIGSSSNELYTAWRSLLPDLHNLRASLPVHWSDKALASTQCTALEASADCAYFARAEAVSSILSSIKVDSDDDEVMSENEVHRALDVVQTRSCRVRRFNGTGPPLRLLAPVFDMINHGSGLNKANAAFALEGDSLVTGSSQAALVVRAQRNLKLGEELLIDYGDSAKPAWKCLLSYGFVPPPDGNDLISEDNADDVHTAEIFMGGKRYDVSASYLPYDLVVDTAERLKAENRDEVDLVENENPLTLEVAESIVERVSTVAVDILGKKAQHEAQSPAEEIAFSLASQLRLMQRDILLRCVAQLRDYIKTDL